MGGPRGGGNGGGGGAARAAARGDGAPGRAREELPAAVRERGGGHAITKTLSGLQ